MQLKSAAAVVDYLQRVLPLGNVRLGDETARYYELADADEEAPPAPSGVATTLGGTQLHGPKLPQEPAESRDKVGYDIFRQVIEDVATAPLDGDQELRLELLGLIDKMAVGHREKLGRLLLRRLDIVSQISLEQLMMQHQNFFLDGGRLHLFSSVRSSLSGYIREMHRNWVQLRRQEYIKAAGLTSGAFPWTVGVL